MPCCISTDSELSQALSAGSDVDVFSFLPYVDDPDGFQTQSVVYFKLLDSHSGTCGTSIDMRSLSFSTAREPA